MREYTIVRRPVPMDWDAIPTLRIESELPLQDTTHEVSAKAQLCYDDKALYVRLCAVEPYIRAEHYGPLGEICEDSCLEFFFSPIEGDDRYLNIEVNPNGAMYKGIATNVQTLQRLIPENALIVPTITRTADGWTVEYAIPYEFVRLFFPGFSPAPGSTIRANCFKCAELSAQPHWLCWSPIPREVSTFHSSAHFGTMYFA